MRKHNPSKSSLYRIKLPVTFLTSPRSPLPPSRALPSPLLTKEYLPAFASIADLEDLKEQVRTLNLLVLLLPDLHQSVLKVRGHGVRG